MTTTLAPILAGTPSAGSISSGRTDDARASHVTCYHCGAPLDRAPALHAEMAGASRDFCCAGCQTIAMTLHASGMGHVYDGPIAFARPIDGEARTEAEAAWATYDLPVMRERFVRTHEDGVEEVSLTLVGMRCAACVWLIERALARVPGVRESIVNYATERVRIVSEAGAVRLADLFAAIADVGYEAWPDQPSLRRTAEARERRHLLIRLGIAMLGMMQVMMYAWPVYLHGGSIPADQVALMQWASLALTTPVVLFSAGPIFRSAWQQVRHAHVGMDVPVALGIGAAFAASVAATVRGHGATYFDSVTMFVAFLLAARYLELRARQSATSGTEALVRQLPATCRRIVDGAESTQTVPVAALQAGDCVEVRAGEILPADGVIERGTTEVDESLLSGESLPQPRGVGAAVLAGSYNVASAIRLRVHRVGAQTRLAAIVDLLDRALTDKPRMAELADRVAGRFVMVLLGWAALTACAWWWIDPGRMFAVTVAVLVVSCPCALSLATPSALAAASGALARRGVLVTRGHAIESLAAVTDVLLDKTGTLTQGRLRLLSIETFDDLDAQRCLALACALEQAENHPIAQSLRAAVDAPAPSMAVDEVLNVPGQGVRARWQAQDLRLGTQAFAAGAFTGQLPRTSVHVGSEPAEGMPPAACTAIWLGRDGRPLARFVLADTPRADAAACLDALRGQGLRLHLVSGDAPETVRWWAARLGIAHAEGGASPEDKRAYVRALQAGGARVLAVGDGINDAPLLAQAQVSIAIGTGAPLAQAGADAILTEPRLPAIGEAVSIGRRTLRVVRQNLGWAFAYNAVSIPLATLGWLSPLEAGIGMSLSSLLVALNAWRLSRAA
ncbi:heavy metal translocating P-type ATPase [Ralstonia solanacearum]|uniref:heavy metal translocating P-type ATPase n=1 Tax=Ralstonia solanacearum TaxID=305 RepID=UPI000500BBD5|nr:heavy metal translocating P-type ATPase [Ralstonia solanacearum]KFX30148.1 carbonate dehydratase [Ralstonia solanacearum]